MASKVIAPELRFDAVEVVERIDFDAVEVVERIDFDAVEVVERIDFEVFNINQHGPGGAPNGERPTDGNRQGAGKRRHDESTP